MVGKSSRSSYKRNRKGTVSGHQRYKKDEALNVSNSSCSEVSDDVISNKWSWCSKYRWNLKKENARKQSAESEYTIENPQNCQEYWVIYSLNCLSTAVSSMQHVCGVLVFKGKIPFNILLICFQCTYLLI
jgi:hypothetical protein